jgi:hypothetical protein
MPTPLGATHRTHKDLVVGYDVTTTQITTALLGCFSVRIATSRTSSKSNEMAHSLLARDGPNILPERFVSIPLFSPPDPVRASGGSGHV